MLDKQSLRFWKKQGISRCLPNHYRNLSRVEVLSSGNFCLFISELVRMMKGLYIVLLALIFHIFHYYLQLLTIMI